MGDSERERERKSEREGDDGDSEGGNSSRRGQKLHLKSARWLGSCYC